MTPSKLFAFWLGWDGKHYTPGQERGFSKEVDWDYLSDEEKELAVKFQHKLQQQEGQQAL